MAPYNPLWSEELLAKGIEAPAGASASTRQVFALAYLCQGCKSVPEVFLVERDKLRLNIAGRAPMEHVAVPRDIPRDVRRFFSGAVVAHQSGHTLAGVFMLRTLLEQWARKATESLATDYTDAVIQKYMESLPEDFRGRFPSIRPLYSELSADIHSAIGSTELFDAALKQIVEHFEARRLFRLAAPGQLLRMPQP